jgi:hypothetical protein
MEKGLAARISELGLSGPARAEHNWVPNGVLGTALHRRMESVPGEALLRRDAEVVVDED